MVTWKLATRLSLVILILIFAAACSRDGETTVQTSTPTLDSTATPGGTPAVSPALTPVTPVAVTRPKPVTGPVDGYLAVAPSVLRSNAVESVSVSLFSRGRPASGNVMVALLSNGVPVSKASGFIEGQGSLDVRVPVLADGIYELAVEGPGFNASQQLQVESRTVLFLETDKPVYKPGQTVNIRALLLDPELKPVAGQVVVEAQDAKGIKIFRKTTTSDDYGMSTLDLPLSNEPNLGVWKLTAFSGNRKTQLDIRVDEYVLPKYDVAVDLPKSWILANEPITGAVSSEYSFGRPVKGEVTITATRYVGIWEEYASVVEQLDGTTTFELPAPGYVAGVPGAGGLGNVQLHDHGARTQHRVRRDDHAVDHGCGHTVEPPGDTREQRVQAGAAVFVPGSDRNAGQSAAERGRVGQDPICGQGTGYV